jgi:isoleucyl-tRNA synthetase
MFPTPLKEALNPRIEEAVARMQTVIQLGRQARERRNTPLKMPLNRFTIIHKDAQYRADVEELKSYILAEMNVKEVQVTNDDSIVAFVAKPDFQALGKRLRKDLPKVQNAIKALTDEQIRQFQVQGKIDLQGHTITTEEMLIERQYKGDQTKTEAAWDNDVLTILDLTVDEAMAKEGQAREVMNRIQKLRKKAGITPIDPIEVFYTVDESSPLAKVINDMKPFIKSSIGVPFSHSKNRSPYSTEIISESADVANIAIKILICHVHPVLSNEAHKKFADEKLFNAIQLFLATRDYATFMKKIKETGKVQFTLNDKNVELQFNADVFASVEEAIEKK